MFSPLLTICIPSYNRLPSVKNTLSKLFSLETELEFKVIIIDNASCVNYLEELSVDENFRYLIDDKKLEIHRNFTNIGMSANIMRSFEKVSSGWLWIMSDDDDICNDAFSLIHKELKIQEASNLSCIYFGNYDGVDDYIVLENLTDFIDLNSGSIDNFNQSIFLSNTLYRISDAAKYISTGYMNGGTFIPHFMMVVSIINDGLKVKYINSSIINYIKPEVGYSYSIVAGLGVGMPKHSILNLSNGYYQKFNSMFYPHNDFKVIVDLYFETKSNKPAFKHLSHYYLSYIKTVRPLVLYLGVSLFRLLAMNDFVFEKTINLFCFISPRVRNDVKEIRKRNGF